MSKPGADPSSGISSVDVLILTERHPACRQREARPGSCTEPPPRDNSADVADAMERTRESIDESRGLMADVADPIVRWITALLEPRRPRHCWSASVCRPDSPPNLLIETLGC